MDMPRRSRSKGRHGSGASSLSALKPMKQMRVSASTPPTSATSTTPSRIRSAPSAMEAAPDAHAITSVSRGPSSPNRKATASACARGRTERRARRPGAGRPLRDLTPVPRLGLVHAAAHRPDEAGRPAPIRPSSAASAIASAAAASASRSALERRRDALRPSSTSAGTSAATRERNPSVSMAVTGRMAQAPADRPVHRLLTPAPYGLTTPSPLTTTRGDAARLIPARTWTGRSAPGSRGTGTRRSGPRARRSRCRSAPRCPRTAR